jgi:hypothetical protein
LNDAEPAFLKGQSAKSGVEVSPIKIVKNPDGSMQRAAATQAALAKERRELRETQSREAAAAVPREPAAAAAWLHAWWRRIDRWILANHGARALPDAAVDVVRDDVAAEGSHAPRDPDAPTGGRVD